jgi:hypothetical protein
MPFARHVRNSFGAILLMSMATTSGAAPATMTVSPENMPRIATVDDRFQSYNVKWPR